MLVNNSNATVTIIVEIGVDFPKSVPDRIKRVVSENAASLAFNNKTWEQPSLDYSTVE